jgi:hypothetical protein
VQCLNSSAVFTPLLCLICFAKPFAADDRLFLAVSGREEEKKKGRGESLKRFLCIYFPGSSLTLSCAASLVISAFSETSLRVLLASLGYIIDCAIIVLMFLLLLCVLYNVCLVW